MTTREEFKHLYAEKQAEFNLPDFEQLDTEFEIYDLFITKRIPMTYLVRNTRRFCVDKLWAYINYLHGFLYPNQQSMIMVEESQKMSEEDKNEMVELMKKLTIVARKAVIYELKNDEAQNAKYISEIFSIWQESKQHLSKIADKNVKLWQDSSKSEKDLSYYG